MQTIRAATAMLIVASFITASGCVLRPRPDSLMLQGGLVESGAGRPVRASLLERRDFDEALLQERGTEDAIIADTPVGASLPGDSIFFASGSYELTAEARNILQRQAEWLLERPELTVRVEGSTDVVERATPEEALALGVWRAIAAKDYLVELGVLPSRIVIQSNGMDRPRDPRIDEAAHAANRHVRTVAVPAAQSAYRISQ